MLIKEPNRKKCWVPGPETLLSHQDLYCTGQVSFQRPSLLNCNDDAVA